MKKIFLSFCFVFFNFALFASGKGDDFSFEKIEKKYPSSSYIWALGQGASLENAASSAKLSVCQTLGESLRGEQKTTSFSDSRGKEESSLSTSVEEAVLFEHITGIVIKETWRADKGNGDWIALAVLDKKEAADYYSKLAMQKNSEISSLVLRAEEIYPSFDSLSLLSDALLKAQDNQYNLDLLLVLNRTKHAMTRMSYGSVQKLNLLYREKAAGISVSVNVEDDSEGLIYSALVEKLKEKGVSVVNSNAQYEINAVVKLEEQDSLDSKNFYARYSFFAPLTMENSTVVKPFSITGREGHISLEQAYRRCYIKIASRIKDEFLR
ncbi:hypothetical protein [Treponema pectinovorum]|uniref:hypothetical protein n=1 Tax=Treponema pectinovorum TaxID=164 RepID=UPI003D90FD36